MDKETAELLLRQLEKQMEIDVCIDIDKDEQTGEYRVIIE